MMRPIGEVQVYLHRAPIDMRLGRNGLAAIAQEVIKADPFAGGLFLFVGKRFDALKILWWGAERLRAVVKETREGTIRLAEHQRRGCGVDDRRATEPSARRLRCAGSRGHCALAL
jgi:transposase